LIQADDSLVSETAMPEAGAGVAVDSEGTSRTRSQPKRKLASFALRLALGFGVLGFLLWRADLGLVLQTMARVSLVWLGLALLVQLVGKLIWAMRWSATLDIFGFHAPLGILVRGILIGQFFNNFLPSSVGGDFYRGFWILDDPKLYRKSLFLVFTERFLGLIALGLVALPALLFLVVRGRPVWDANLLGIFLLLVGLCATTVVFHPSVFGWIDRRLRPLRARPLADLRGKLLESLRLLQEAGWLRSKAFLLSLVVQLVGVAFYYCLGRGLGVPMAAWQYLVVVPLVVVATILPVTFNGLGIREGALVLLTGALGIDVTPNEALALGLLSSAVLVLVSLIGGGFYIVGKRHGTR
jgi:glycosyltransferase 2 family protein